MARRCEVRGCRDDAVGELVYKGHPKCFYPLCEKHSDPKFHRRPLGTLLRPTAWSWKPFKKKAN